MKCPKCGAPDYEQNAEWFRDNDITWEGHYEFECTRCWHVWERKWPLNAEVTNEPQSKAP